MEDLPVWDLPPEIQEELTEAFLKVDNVEFVAWARSLPEESLIRHMVEDQGRIIESDISDPDEQEFALLKLSLMEQYDIGQEVLVSEGATRLFALCVQADRMDMDIVLNNRLDPTTRYELNSHLNATFDAYAEHFQLFDVTTD
jgi:hypothetical protein